MKKKFLPIFPWCIYEAAIATFGNIIITLIFAPYFTKQVADSMAGALNLNNFVKVVRL